MRDTPLIGCDPKRKTKVVTGLHDRCTGELLVSAFISVWDVEKWEAQNGFHLSMPFVVCSQQRLWWLLSVRGHVVCAQVGGKLSRQICLNAVCALIDRLLPRFGIIGIA